MPITKGFRQLVDEANAQITTYSVEQVRARLDDPTVQIVDIRDVRELEREGTVPICNKVRGAPPSAGPPRSRHTPAASRLSVTAALARHTSAASCCAPPPPVCGVLATFRCGQHSALSRHTPWMSFNRKETR